MPICANKVFFIINTIVLYYNIKVNIFQDLNNWIEGSGEQGVIYFSLGSVTRGNSLPIKYRDMFVSAFAKIKQRIIWKFESDLQVSKNVMIRKWFPQQDILGDYILKFFLK